MVVCEVQISVSEVDRVSVDMEPIRARCSFLLSYSSFLEHEKPTFCALKIKPKRIEKQQNKYFWDLDFLGNRQGSTLQFSFLYIKEYVYMLQGPRLKNKGQNKKKNYSAKH